MVYQSSTKHKQNINQARLTALQRVKCKHCEEYHTLGNIAKHENKCIHNLANYVTCLACSKLFLPKRKRDGSKTTTCSRSCSNTIYRTGPNHGNWNPDRYTTTCFHFHKRECVVCGEDKIVEVHHLDENHTNNDPNNLIPLCPTHHQYWHSKYKHLIEDVVLSYIKGWSG